MNDGIHPFGFAERMQTSIRVMTIARFENSGHDLFYDELGKVYRELLAFLAR